MNILVVNTGSSSVKVQRVVTRERQESADEGVVAFSANLENLKQTPKLIVDGKSSAAKAQTHAEGFNEILQRCKEKLDVGSIDVVAHRVVHGGAEYVEPTIITDKVAKAIRNLDALAPLHNEAAFQAIAAARELLPKAKHVAVFDTALFADLPETAKTYGIDYALAQKHGIRRFGFHGTAYRYMLARYAKTAGVSLATSKVIAVHLGGGCSVAAISEARAIETSMGMTPLEGLVMGTRAGDIDPGVIGVIADREKLSLEATLTLLNQTSGLRALSGITEDTRVLVKKRETEPRAQLALDVFCHRIVKYVGAYLGAMQGADAILLGGVINENTPYVRAEVCKHFEWAGLTLDTVRNDALIDREGLVSTDDSRLKAWVIPAREDLQLALEATRLVVGGAS
jgi:acetate kinase